MFGDAIFTHHWKGKHIHGRGFEPSGDILKTNQHSLIRGESTPQFPNRVSAVPVCFFRMKRVSWMNKLTFNLGGGGERMFDEYPDQKEQVDVIISLSDDKR